jgi:hypothetical protein
MKMAKRLSVVLLALLLVVMAGCSTGSQTTTTVAQPANLDVVRQAEIGGQWTVMQVRINLDSELPVLMKLAPGDLVEGYFYLEKGTDVDFQVSGVSQIYQEVSPFGASGNITSGRFSFTASQAQGIAYTLTFTPVVKTEGKKVTPVIFMELIYPKTGELFNPMGTK